MQSEYEYKWRADRRICARRYAIGYERSLAWCIREDISWELSRFTDFDSSIDDSVRENSTSTAHDSSDKNLTTDDESERNDHDSLEEASDLIGSLDSSQNLSSSNDSIADTTNGSTTDNQHDRSSSDSANESQCTSHSDTNLPSNTVDSIALSNNNIDAQSSNNNIGTNVHDGNDQLDSTAKSKNSQERCFWSLLLATSTSFNAISSLHESRLRRDACYRMIVISALRRWTVRRRWRTRTETRNCPKVTHKVQKSHKLHTCSKQTRMSA